MHRDVNTGTGLTVPGRCSGACIRGTLVAVLSIDGVNDGRTWITPPKSRDGLRTVAFPATLVPAGCRGWSGKLSGMIDHCQPEQPVQAEP